MYLAQSLKSPDKARMCCELELLTKCHQVQDRQENFNLSQRIDTLRLNTWGKRDGPDYVGIKQPNISKVSSFKAKSDHFLTRLHIFMPRTFYMVWYYATTGTALGAYIRLFLEIRSKTQGEKACSKNSKLKIFCPKLKTLAIFSIL